MPEAYICDPVRTPIGRYGGSLSAVRADDLGAVPIRELMARNGAVDAEAIDDLVYGCANQAGEDNRNVARMSLLLAGLPDTVPGATVNRLCGSGMNAVGICAQAVRTGEADLTVAGGVESMSRAPFVMGKADTAFSRKAEIYDTTIGWRFVNRMMKKQYGTDSMPETAENVAEEFQVSREDQDAFAARSQARAVAAQENGNLASEIVPVTIPQRRGDPVVVDKDEHPRAGTTVEKLAGLPTPFRDGGTVTAGNASGVNDGAAAMFVGVGKAGGRRLRPRAARPGRRHGDRRRAAAHHGHRPGAGLGKAAGPARPQDRRHGRDRAISHNAVRVATRAIRPSPLHGEAAVSTAAGTVRPVPRTPEWDRHIHGINRSSTTRPVPRPMRKSFRWSAPERRH